MHPTLGTFTCNLSCARIAKLVLWLQGYGQGAYQAQSQAPPPGYALPQSHTSAPMVPQYAHPGTWLIS